MRQSFQFCTKKAVHKKRIDIDKYKFPTIFTLTTSTQLFFCLHMPLFIPRMMKILRQFPDAIMRLSLHD